MNTEKMPLENENEPSCLGAVSSSRDCLRQSSFGTLKKKIKKALRGRCKTHKNKMAKFRKKPVIIEAITFDELVKHGLDNGANVNNGMPWSWNYGGHPITHENDQCYLIPTMEGTMQMTPNDMLITGVKGEIYPCKIDIFEATYEKVED